MENNYIEQRDGGYWVAGTRISLDSIVVAFQEGLSPETIVTECFPTVTLEQAYGAITFYLANRREVDVYLKQADTEFKNLKQDIQNADRAFTRKLARAKRQIKVKHQ